MTAIVACEYRGKVHMGGDSAATDGFNTIEIIDDPKVWTRGGLVFGGCGEIRYLELVRHVLKVPKVPAGKKVDALDRWLTVDLANALRACWKADVELRAQEEKTPPVELLIGVCGRVYYCGGDLCFTHPAAGHIAIGSGSEIALGSLDETTALKRPKERLARALTRAANRTAFVRPPFRYVSA